MPASAKPSLCIQIDAMQPSLKPIRKAVKGLNANFDANSEERGVSDAEKEQLIKASGAGLVLAACSTAACRNLDAWVASSAAQCGG